MGKTDLVKFKVGYCQHAGLLGVSQSLKVKSVRRHFMEIIVVARLNPMSLPTKHANNVKGEIQFLTSSIYSNVHSTCLLLALLYCQIFPSECHRNHWIGGREKKA